MGNDARLVGSDQRTKSIESLAEPLVMESNVAKMLSFYKTQSYHKLVDK